MNFNDAAVAFVLGVAFCAWCAIGLLGIIMTDIFGRRNDYEQPYPFTKWDYFKGGPLVWMILAVNEIFGKKKK